MDLKQAIRKSARQARLEGKINFRQALRLRAATYSPAAMDQITLIAVVEATADDAVAVILPYGEGGEVIAAQIDWAELSDFLLNTVLPLVLALLEALA